ncbi:hypothetical protein FLAVO9AF_160122 [Flavobacterium sp. 9AF]|nr:hypothetical protein FLAVO9AF_160122 [Flavobacterium sp. 9AF]
MLFSSCLVLCCYYRGANLEINLDSESKFSSILVLFFKNLITFALSKTK